MPIRKAQRIARYVGRRGMALLFFAGVFTCYGLSLVRPTDEAPTTALFRWFGDIMPMPAWGYLWLACAVVCAVTALTREHSSDWIGYGAAIFITAVWGLISTAGWLVEDVQISSVGIWIGFAGFVCLIAGWHECPPHGDDQA